MRKTIFVAIFMLFVSSAMAWPPIPKAIASGKGIRIVRNKLPIPFLWFVGISLADDHNIYVLVSTRTSTDERHKFESSNMEVVIHDEGSILVRIRIDTKNLDSRQITYDVARKITSVFPYLIFNSKDALYNPRP